MQTSAPPRRAHLLGSFLLLALGSAGALLAHPAPAGPPGALVIVGGGGTPEVVLQRALERAGGPEAPVVVLPQASAREERGVSSVAMWEQVGALDVRLVDGLTAEEARAALERAALVWMPGGSQSRLMQELGELGLVEAVRAAHRRGAVVAGTSAGAAVMSAVMIRSAPEHKGVRAGATPVGPGLGLLPGAVVDQHFVQRGRDHRLLEVVLERPELLGVGIDERTAILVEPDGEFEVLGESVVLVYDAREASVEPTEPGANLGARGLGMQLLRAGMRCDLLVEREER